MNIKDDTLIKILSDHDIVSKENLLKLKKQADLEKTSLYQVIINSKSLTEKNLLETYGKYIGIPFVDLEERKIEKDILEKIPEKIASKYRAIVFGEDEGLLKVAIEDPSDFQAIQFIEKDLNYKLKFYITTPKSISKALDQYKGELTTEVKKVIKDESADEEEQIEETAESAEKLREVIQEAPITKAINLILEYAVKTRASDIHIEPREKYVHIRYRIDGVLRDTMSLPKKIMPSIISRVKIMANLRIDEHRVPQDGRIKINLGSSKISVRVSTMPIIDGEKIVLRLLDESTKASTLEELGFIGNALDIIKMSLKKPHGMLLITGPTGSGKSTTLYSILSGLNTIGINISTVEDPVEYRIEGINQTPVNSKVGMTFATGLRALLRQDPDVIMVGEIRDSETAEIAVHAALTGHVVLSTLHTNNASGTLPRLLDMNVEAFLIASTVNAVIAQRLVRKLCPYCKEKYSPSEELVKEIKKDFNIPKETLEKEISSMTKQDVPKNSLKINLYRSKGCEHCEESGYLGRMGIFEVLDVNDEIGELIIKRASSEEIQDTAIKQGMLTMQQDGFIKAAKGLTTIEEILRVTKE